MAGTAAARGYNALTRFKNFLKLLLSNKMAAAGLVLLVTFSILALAANLITPHDPQQTVVSGSYAQPAWARYVVPQGPVLSENLLWAQDPAFSTPESVAEWTVTTEPQPPSAILAYEPGVNSPKGQAQGAASLTYTREAGSPAGNVTLTLAKKVHYPYNGPPSKFVATASVEALGATPSETVRARTFVQRLTDNWQWFLWETNFIGTGQWDGVSADSSTTSVKTYMGLAGTAFTPSQIVFSRPVDYLYGLTITLDFNQTALEQKQLVVYVDDLDMELRGTSFGLFGTDNQGRDLFTQFVYGARLSLFVGLLAAVIGIVLGLLVGLVAGYLGGAVDELMMRFTDMLLVIPGLPLLLILIAVLGPSLFNLIVLIGFLGWMGFARVIRSQVLSLKERPFIEAARASGAGTWHITLKHVFPNIVSLTYINLALAVPAAILTEAALSFLGLGDPSVTTWGAILFHAGQENALFLWWWVLPPGLGIAAVSLSFVLIGYSLDEIFNPKLRKRR